MPGIFRICRQKIVRTKDHFLNKNHHGIGQCHDEKKNKIIIYEKIATKHIHHPALHLKSSNRAKADEQVKIFNFYSQFDHVRFSHL